MIVDLLEKICNKLNYSFNYGGEHWQNLQDFEPDEQLAWIDRKKHFLLLYQSIRHRYNEFNALVATNYNLEYVISVRSKISDPDYNYKYKEHIKNLQLEIKEVENILIGCSDGIQINSTEIDEVSNVYDTNLDGLKVKLKIEINTDIFDASKVIKLRYNVILTGITEGSRIPVASFVRQYLDINVSEAISIVDNPPSLIKGDLDEPLALQLKEEIENVGGIVILDEV